MSEKIAFVVWFKGEYRTTILASSDTAAEQEVYRLHYAYVSEELKAGGLPDTVRHWSWCRVEALVAEREALKKRIVSLEEELSYAQVARDNALTQRDEMMDRSKQRGKTMGSTIAEALQKLSRYDILTDEELLFLKKMHHDGDRLYKANESRINDLHHKLVFGVIAAREPPK